MTERPSRAILAGGSGFLGRALAASLLARGWQVVILTRTPLQTHHPRLLHVRWDGRTAGDWCASLHGAGAVINLAGRTLNCRYTPSNRREIVRSRVDSVAALADAIVHSETPPPVWIQAGSLGIYGNPGDRWCDESAPPGSGFPARAAADWESAFDSAACVETRKVLLRMGFVLGRDGGALQPLATLARLGLGGTAGDGRTYLSWIHMEDIVRMFLWAIENAEIQGVYNATSPHPVSNRDFMRHLRRAVCRPWSPPLPAWTVRLGALLIRTDPSFLLTGRRCSPGRFTSQGFWFAFPDLRQALSDLLHTPK